MYLCGIFFCQQPHLVVVAMQGKVFLKKKKACHLLKIYLPIWQQSQGLEAQQNAPGILPLFLWLQVQL